MTSDTPCKQAVAHFEKQEYSFAIKEANKCIRMLKGSLNSKSKTSEHLHERISLAEAYKLLGNTYFLYGSLKDSKKQYSLAKKVYQKIGRPINITGLAEVEYSLALISQIRGYVSEAINRFQNSADLYKERGEKSFELRSKLGIAKIRLASRDVKQAKLDYEQILEECDDIKYKSPRNLRIAETKQGLAQIYALSDVERALALIKDARKKFGKTKQRQSEGRAMVLHAQLLRLSGNEKETRKLLITILKFSKKHRDPFSYASALNIFSEIATENGDFKAAREYLERSIQVSKDLENKEAVATALLQLSYIRFQEYILQESNTTVNEVYGTRAEGEGDNAIQENKAVKQENQELSEQIKRLDEAEEETQLESEQIEEDDEEEDLEEEKRVTLDDILFFAEQAAEYFRQLGKQNEQARSLELQGLFAIILKRYKVGLENLNKARRLYRTVKDKEKEFNSTYVIVMTNLEIQDFTSAIRLFETRKKLFETYLNEEQLIRVFAQIVKLAEESNDPERAKQYSEKITNLKMLKEKEDMQETTA